MARIYAHACKGRSRVRGVEGSLKLKRERKGAVHLRQRETKGAIA